MIWIWPTVGEVSAVAVPSASHAAVTPAELTPCQALDVVVTPRLILRHGFAEPALVRTMLGALLLTPDGRGAGHLCQPLRVSAEAGLYLHPRGVPRT